MDQPSHEPDAPTYEVLALRYATQQDRPASANFLLPDDHASPMPMDYYIWAIRGGGRTIIVDTGFGPDAAARRGRTLLRSPVAALAEAGINAASVVDVILTHLHYDHAGCLGSFPAATFHLQDAEMAYATGRAMCHRTLRAPVDLEDVVDAVRHLFANRVRFHSGTAVVAPGVTVHLIGGHSGGLQVVRVPTSRGWIVLASDAAHYWANLREANPFPLVADVLAMVEGWRMCSELADGPEHVIPGHDPLVLARFPAAPGTVDTVRLDLLQEDFGTP